MEKLFYKLVGWALALVIFLWFLDEIKARFDKWIDEWHNKQFPTLFTGCSNKGLEYSGNERDNNAPQDKDQDKSKDKDNDRDKDNQHPSIDIHLYTTQIQNIQEEFVVINNKTEVIQQQINNFLVENTTVEETNVTHNIIIQKKVEVNQLLQQINNYEEKLTEILNVIQQGVDNQQIHDLLVEISQLQIQLNSQKSLIRRLLNQIDVLLKEKEASEEEMCYYVIGPTDSLLAHDIIKSRFFGLGGYEVRSSGFDESYYLPIDSDSPSIPLYSQRIDVLSDMPEDSYEIRNMFGQYVLYIKDNDKFWGKTNRLVISVEK